MKILVVMAHPDDEVLGCGGTMAKLGKAGHEVYTAILGEGLTSRSDWRRLADGGGLDALRDSCRRAAGLLGVRDVVFGSFPDNRFDERPLLEVVKFVEEIVGKVEPHIVYTHHGGDLNVDHAAVFRAVLTALRPMKGTTVRRVLSCEIPSSTEWAFGSFRPAFEPNVFEDISDTLELKIRAMEEYGGEIRGFPHPRSPEAIEALARTRGSAVGMSAAEAFRLVWERAV